MLSQLYSSHDPSFSVYDFIPPYGSYYTSFTDHRRLLASWCKHMEEETLKRKLKVEVFAGFQQVRYLTPLRERYRQLATITSNVWIFGERGADEPLPVDGLSYVTLKPEDMLTREWFLVVYAPTYARALVARETTLSGTPHARRQFQGIISSEMRLVREMHEQLSGYVGSAEHQVQISL